MISTILLLAILALYLVRYLAPAFAFRFPKVGGGFNTAKKIETAPFLWGQAVVNWLAKIIGGK